MKKKIIVTNVVSMFMGIGIGMMFASKEGKKIREDLKDKIGDDLSIKNDMQIALDKIELSLQELKSIKVKKVVEDKALVIKKDLERIIDASIKKKDRVVEKAAKDMKEKSINVINDVLEKFK